MANIRERFPCKTLFNTTNIWWELLLLFYFTDEESKFLTNSKWILLYTSYTEDHNITEERSLLWQTRGSLINLSSPVFCHPKLQSTGVSKNTLMKHSWAAPSIRLLLNLSICQDPQMLFLSETLISTLMFISNFFNVKLSYLTLLLRSYLTLCFPW